MLREEAALRDRTIRSQALHCLAIGKAIEASGIYTHAGLTALLNRLDAETRPE
ncbi:TA system antitoxin ParD family protein [Shimia sp. Alg240-R146]|uniref:TA system antitoxin ParD family protein n=1 Tax=Shimia sp. Alg240-R146 TaxID=2993449 RepID=UPI003FA7C5F4